MGAICRELLYLAAHGCADLRLIFMIATAKYVQEPLQ